MELSRGDINVTGVNEVFFWDGGISHSQTRPHADGVARLVSRLWPLVSRPPPTATATCHCPCHTPSPSTSWLPHSTGRHCQGAVTSHVTVPVILCLPQHCGLLTPRGDTVRVPWRHMSLSLSYSVSLNIVASSLHGATLSGCHDVTRSRVVSRSANWRCWPWTSSVYPAVVGSRPYNKTHDIYSDCHLGRSTSLYDDVAMWHAEVTTTDYQLTEVRVHPLPLRLFTPNWLHLPCV